MENEKRIEINRNNTSLWTYIGSVAVWGGARPYYAHDPEKYNHIEIAESMDDFDEEAPVYRIYPIHQQYEYLLQKVIENKYPEHLAQSVIYQEVIDDYYNFIQTLIECDTAPEFVPEEWS